MTERAIPDEEALFEVDLHWEADPEQFTRLRTLHEGRWLYMWINTSFPDDPLYSLEVGPDETRELDELPRAWSRGPLRWPDTAKPRPGK